MVVALQAKEPEAMRFVALVFTITTRIGINELRPQG